MNRAPVSASGCKWAADGAFVCSAAAAGGGRSVEGFVDKLKVGGTPMIAGAARGFSSPNSSENVVRAATTTAYSERPVGPIPRHASKYPDGTTYGGRK